jgi:signal transduction histidine kinase
VPFVAVLSLSAFPWPTVTWLHILSDLLLAIAYVAIPVMLTWIVVHARWLPFRPIYLAFGVFTLTCGFVHLAEVVTFWSPISWLSASIKIICAVSSIATTLVLIPVVPKAIAVARAARAARERGLALETAYAELGKLYERTRALDEAKARFFANVSHELRTPLALVLGHLEKWSSSGDVPLSLRSDLRVALRNARMLQKYVNDLLDIARMEAEQLSLRYAHVDLAQAVRLTSSQFESMARERGISFVCDAPGSLQADVDPEAFDRILLNLLSNAFKFSPDGGSVRCALTEEAARAILIVEDTGPGVPLGLREKVFERFQRLDEPGSRRTTVGTGLGLAIVKELVELHAGTVRVGDAAGGGARFTVEIPTRAPADVSFGETAQRSDSRIGEALAAADVGPPPASPGPTDSGRPLVLVVEDNPDMRRFLSGVLAADYHVEEAQNGKEGLARAVALKPDLVISDILMPAMGGAEMLRAIRGISELDDVPVVLLTAKAEDSLRVDLLRGGAQDYLIKPCSVEELRARAANLVATKRARDHLSRALDVQRGDLETLARDVATAKREAELSSRIKSNFLALVSHEMRAPVQTLLLELDVLRVKPEPALLGRISAAALQLVRLVDSMIEYAKLQSGAVVPFVEAFDLGALARGVVEENRPQAEQKHLDLRLAAPAGLPPLFGDRHLMRLVLANLVDNAIKYTERGRIDVAVALRNGTHQLTVRDTGVGIPAEMQRAVFEPFRHLEPVMKKHSPGLGVGLALVREIVRLMGGRVELVSAPGEGTCFTISLPSAGETPQGSTRSAA